MNPNPGTDTSLNYKARKSTQVPTNLSSKYPIAGPPEREAEGITSPTSDHSSLPSDRKAGKPAVARQHSQC